MKEFVIGMSFSSVLFSLISALVCIAVLLFCDDNAKKKALKMAQIFTWLFGLSLIVFISIAIYYVNN